MIYTKTPDKRKKISSSSEPHLTDNLHPDLLHSDPLKVWEHFNVQPQFTGPTGYSFQICFPSSRADY